MMFVNPYFRPFITVEGEAESMAITPIRSKSMLKRVKSQTIAKVTKPAKTKIKTPKPLKTVKNSKKAIKVTEADALAGNVNSDFYDFFKEVIDGASDETVDFQVCEGITIGSESQQRAMIEELKDQLESARDFKVFREFLVMLAVGLGCALLGYVVCMLGG